MPKRINYENYEYEGTKILKVVDAMKNGEKIWLARCKCGADFHIQTSKITLKKKVHCGCESKIGGSRNHSNLPLNKKHGISIIKEVQYINNKKHYNLLCRCGNYFLATGSDIGKGHKKHCGCSRNTSFVINGERKEDIIGLTINGNLCIRKENNEWVFRCKCGNFFKQTTCQVTNRPKNSCGCLSIPIKKLKLLDNNCHFISTEYMYGKLFVNLICNCGKLFQDEYNKLYKDRIINCKKCLYNPEQVNIEYNSSKKYYFFDQIKASAKKRHLDLNIDADFCLELLKKQDYKCAIANIEINLTTDLYCRGTASLDRIDSNLGYLKDNVQWLHKTVNFMKRRMSNEELIEWCSIIYKKNHYR